jgi:patatin-like phospholipase/acyl hydrolase
MSDPAQTKPFRVLSLDGGGMRGLYTATVLDTLARHFASRCGATTLDIGKGFDLIVGTSTGGILAASLAHTNPSRG